MANGQHSESRPPATILIVEDDPHVSEIMRLTLQQEGYRVMVARDGDAAFRICLQAAGGVDLLISDVVLPGITGIDLAQFVQTHLPNTKVIVFSGQVDPRTHALQSLRRDTAFLTKPFTPQHLVELVRTTLAQS